VIGLPCNGLGEDGGLDGLLQDDVEKAGQHVAGIITGQRDEARMARMGLHGDGHRRAVHVGHPAVDDGDVELSRSNGLERGVAAFDRRHPVAERGGDPAHHLTRIGVIVGDEDAERRPGGRALRPAMGGHDGHAEVLAANAEEMVYGPSPEPDTPPMIDLVLLVAPVFGLVALGYAAGLAGLIGERANEGLTSYLFVIGAPALMFKLLTAAVFPGVFPWGYWIAYYAGMAVVWGLATVLAARAFRRSHGDAVIAGLATGQANTVLIGIPIILKAYGEEAAFPIAMLLAVNLPITMSLATVMLEGTRAARGGALFAKLGRGLATHPLILAMAAGVACQALGVKPSGVPATMLDMVASTTIPLSLIALGLSLKTYGVRADVPVALMICVLRLIVHPAIAYLVAHHIFGLPPAWTGTVVLFAAMPAGINAYLFAARYGQGVGIASTAVALSTLLSVLTSILWLRVLGIG